MTKREKIQEEIDQMRATVNDPATPEELKKTLGEAIAGAEKQLQKLPEKESPSKKKEPGKPEKKRSSSKKTGTLSLADCKKIIAKYTKERKKESARIKKRHKQGKPTSLTVPET